MYGAVNLRYMKYTQGTQSSAHQREREMIFIVFYWLVN